MSSEDTLTGWLRSKFGLEKGANSNGKRILVVDDESDIRISLATLLMGKGYEVVCAADGSVALEKLKNERFDLMILDLMMPVTGGFAVLQALPEEVAQDMPVVIVTARGADKDIMRGYSKGASYYLVKPFTNREILNIVRYLIEDLDSAQKEHLETVL